MSWRVVVITGIAKLDLKLNFLVVRKEATTRIHLGEIHTLIIASTAVSLTVALINQLLENKIKIIFCDEKSNPQAELMPYYPSHDTSLKIKTQINWREQEKELVWTQIVTEKINNQRKILLQCGYKEQAELLTGYLQTITLGDKTNREGHAAKVYFNALFGVEFSRSQDCPINAALNYGYSILLSSFNKEINANGYLTQLGLFHDNRFNPFNLASDLMEPFRTLVDGQTIKMQPTEFTSKEKMQIVDILNNQVTIAGKIQKVHKAIQIYTKSVFDALNDKEIALLQFYQDEL